MLQQALLYLLKRSSPECSCVIRKKIKYSEICPSPPIPYFMNYFMNQSVWRMHVARKAFLDRRRKVKVIQAAYRRKMAREHFEKVQFVSVLFLFLSKTN